MTRASDLARLVRVSRLYYELGETQAEIARRMGLTRAHVSKLLSQARLEGVVEIRIVDRSEPPNDLAAALRDRFGLRAAHLAPTLAESEELTRRRVGRIAAQILATTVRNGMIVGIGDGSSVGATADAMEEAGSPISATVVPLCGGFWGAEGGREPYRRIADALGAAAHGLLAPGLLDDGATRDALCAHAGIRAITELWARLDVAVFGIGGPSWGEGVVGAEALRELEAAQAVGEVLIAPYDIGGRFVGELLRRRTIAFDARRLPLVPAAIGVANGAAKVVPIVGALRAGVVGTLVTDVDTAARVLEFADRAPADLRPTPAPTSALTPSGGRA